MEDFVLAEHYSHKKKKKTMQITQLKHRLTGTKFVSWKKNSKWANHFLITLLNWTMTVCMYQLLYQAEVIWHTARLTSSKFLSSSHRAPRVLQSNRLALDRLRVSGQAHRSRVWADFGLILPSWRARASVSGCPARASCLPVSSSLFSPARSGVQNASNRATSSSFSPTTRMWKWEEW